MMFKMNKRQHESKKHNYLFLCKLNQTQCKTPVDSVLQTCGIEIHTKFNTLTGCILEKILTQLNYYCI